MTDLFQSTAQQEYERAAIQLKGSKDANSALKKSYARYDNLIASAFENTANKPDCRAGCAYCCHYKVEARAHEILLIRAYIDSNFTDTERSQLVLRANANEGMIRSLTPEQHLTTNIPCMFLQQNTCTIYPVRPFRCRHFHSTDAQACEASFNEPGNMEISTGMIEEVAIVSDAHTQGFEAAAEQTRRDNRIYDFTTALIEALTDDNCSKRYQRGKKTFQQAIEVE